MRIYVITLVYDDDLQAQFVGLTAKAAMDKFNAWSEIEAADSGATPWEPMTDWAKMTAWADANIDGYAYGIVHDVT